MSIQSVAVANLVISFSWWMNVATAFTPVGGGGGGGSISQPIPVSFTEARRICASLCLAGLGGRPCGHACASFAPDNFTTTTSDAAAAAVVEQFTPGGGGARARRDVCPLLCQYQLGEPLCGCRHLLPITVVGDAFSVDFHRICAYFCHTHAYNVLGCRTCTSYLHPQHPDLTRRVRPTDMDIDWDEWCRRKCAIGDGGVACNCDLLPLPMAAAEPPPHSKH